MATLLSVTFEDAVGSQGTFRYFITDAMAASPFTELLAFLQDLVDASQAKIVAATVQNSVPLGGLTGNTTATAGSFDRIGDQAILQMRAGTAIVKATVPAPVDAMFDASGAYALQAVNEADATVTGLVATGITAGLLRNQSDVVVASLDKGWRKGQPHP